MKLATTTNDFVHYGARPVDQLELLSQTPFRYVDMDLPHSVMGDDWESVAETCGELGAKKGLTFVQAHAGDFYIGGPNGQLMLPQLERAITTCARLSIPQVVIHEQWNPAIPYEGGSPARMKEFWDYNLGLYRQLFPVMEKTGVKVLIENTAEANVGPHCFFMTGAEMAAFLDYANHPLLGAVWDIGHANLRANDQRADIVALGDHLCGVHIQDNDGRVDEHTAPFMGTTDLDAVMTGLQEIGFTARGYLTFECFNFPMRGNSWPYSRRTTPGIAPRLLHPSAELKVAAETYLWHIGKYMLEQYGVYEE